MISDPIYKRDSRGAIRTWQFEVVGDKWRTIAGLEDGRKTTSGWTTCTPKSQPTAEAQALFEAQAEMMKKLDRDYRAIRELVDRPRDSTVRPMLAQKYEGWRGGVVYSQPKLDGIRCIANSAGLWTRQGKPITSCPHIVEALKPYFDKDPDLIFDGELYNHDLREDFNAITSAVRKADPHPEAERLIQYHIYDLPSDGGFPFADRWDTLIDIFGLVEGDEYPQGVLTLVPTIGVNDEGSLDYWYSLYLEEGYEGQMVRLSGPYEQKRSNLLLKRKEFQDAEFPVVAIEEGNGNWAGYGKRAVLRLPDGREFGAGIKGNQEFCRSILGQSFEKATVRYFALTPDGVPRFPVVVDLFSGDRA